MNYRSMDHLARLPKEEKKSGKYPSTMLRDFFPLSSMSVCLESECFFFFVSLVWLFKTHERFTTLFACTKSREGKKRKEQRPYQTVRVRKRLMANRFYTQRLRRFETIIRPLRVRL